METVLTFMKKIYIDYWTLCQVKILFMFNTRELRNKSNNDDEDSTHIFNHTTFD